MYVYNVMLFLKIFKYISYTWIFIKNFRKIVQNKSLSMIATTEGSKEQKTLKNCFLLKEVLSSYFYVARQNT